MSAAETRERIKALFPGDENKDLRHQLYSAPNFVKSDPTDDQIYAQAGMIPPPESEHPEPEVKTGELVALAPEKEAEKAHLDAQELVRTAPAVTVTNEEQYQAAAKMFAGIKKMLADNEAKRKSLKAPILEAGRKLDAEFKAAADILERELSRYETPMIAFKEKEREVLRAAGAERQKAIEAEQAKRQEAVQAAMAALDTAHQAKAEAEANPFLAAVMEDTDLADLRTKAEDAIRATAGVEKVIPQAMAPVVADGVRTSYKWAWEVTDEGSLPRSLMSPDPVKINAYVRDLKARVGDIGKLTPEAHPGLRISEEVHLGSGR